MSVRYLVDSIFLVEAQQKWQAALSWLRIELADQAATSEGYTKEAQARPVKASLLLDQISGHAHGSQMAAQEISTSTRRQTRNEGITLYIRSVL